jgi:phytoene desaturase
MESSYDCVVVGSGLGGLSAGAFLAKGGKSVLVVERLDGPGGYVHSFQRGDYTFDPAVHAIGQGKEAQMVDVWLRALGVRERVELIPHEHFYTVVFPDFQLTVPFGIEEYITAHAAEFPGEEEGLRRFVDTCLSVKDEFDRMFAAASVQELGDAGAQFPNILKYRNWALGQVLDEYIGDDRLKAAVGAMWAYTAVPPSKTAFLPYAGMLTSLLDGGQSYCRGSFQKLVDAFVAALEEAGGELVVGTKVDRITVEDGRATGVVLDDGTEVRAGLVISNADATQTFEQLVGLDHLPARFAKRLQKMRPSLSAFTVYTASSTVDLHELGYAHEVFISRSWDPDEVYEEILAGDPASVTMTSTTLADPSLAPEGENLVVFFAAMPYDIGKPWSEERDRYTELLIDQVESIIPDFRDGITFKEGATPLALERFSLNRQGAIYGWENTPDQSLSKRLSNATPIENLFLASAWSQPGPGTVACMQAGFQVAQRILGYADQRRFLQSLGYSGPTLDRIRIS